MDKSLVFSRSDKEFDNFEYFLSYKRPKDASVQSHAHIPDFEVTEDGDFFCKNEKAFIKVLAFFCKSYYAVWGYNYLTNRLDECNYDDAIKNKIRKYIQYLYLSHEEYFKLFLTEIKCDCYYESLKDTALQIMFETCTLPIIVESALYRYARQNSKREDYAERVAILTVFYIYYHSLSVEEYPFDEETYYDSVLINASIQKMLFREVANEILQKKNGEIGRNVVKRVHIQLLSFMSIIGMDVFPDLRHLNINELKASKRKLHDLISDKSGEAVLEISWSNVLFFNGYIALYHPNNPNDSHPFLYDMPASKKAYNQIPSAFINRLPRIQVVTENNRIVKVVDIANISDCIEAIEKKAIKDKQIKKKQFVVKQLHNASNKEIIVYIKEKDSAYLDYLCNKQLPEHHIYYNRERRINTSNQNSHVTEDAFIFTIGESEKELMIVYENVEISRSTLMLHVKREGLQEVIDEVSAFFASAEVNKREQLARGTIEFENKHITWTRRVMHTSFKEWEEYMIAYEKQL